MQFRFCWLLLVIFFSNARNPFSFKHKKCVAKRYGLKGTIIGEDCSFAHIVHDNTAFIVCVGDKLKDWLVVDIHFEDIVLKNKNGKSKTLKIDESMKIGDGA